MKCKAIKFWIRLLVWGLVIPIVLSAQDRRQEERDTAKYYQKWLNEDVLYLVTEEERAVFSQLTTDDERDQFIEQFWHRRDTDLTTAVNEYREEHYRRLAYVSEHFGSGIPGWKTDRGRIYIMFGEPAQREYHAGGGTEVRKPYEGGGRTATYPYEIWRYRYIPGVGDDIEVEFVDRSWTGEFRIALYPWEKDMLLHVDGLGETIAERLGLAQRSQRPGLHPGHLNNSHFMTRLMGARSKDRPFERMRQYFGLQRPPEIRQKELQTIVDTRISYEMLPFSLDLYHVWMDNQTALVPITIEVPNDALDYVTTGGDYRARVGIYGRVTSMAGKVVAEFEHVLSSQFPEAYLEAAQKRGSLFQKAVAVPTGRYKVEIVVKDMTSGDLGTANQTLRLIAPAGESLAAGPVVLAEQLEPLERFPETPETFVVGDVRVVPKVDRRFKTIEPLGVYLQVYNPTLDSSSLEPAVSVEYTIHRGREAVTADVDSDGASIEFFSPQRLVLVRKMTLENLEKGSYRLTVRVSDSISGQSVTSQADFQVTGD